MFLLCCGQIKKYVKESGREVGVVVIPCKVLISLPIPAEQFIVVMFVVSGETR